MDARPHRPRIAVPRVDSENMPPSELESAHQRHKSTGNLELPVGSGVLQAAAKRTVFGDVSNVVRNVTSGPGNSGPQMGKADGNLKNIPRVSESFSKPAQRPVPAVGSVRPGSKPVEPINLSGNNNARKLVVRKDEQVKSKQHSLPILDDCKVMRQQSEDKLKQELHHTLSFPVDGHRILNQQEKQQGDRPTCGDTCAPPIPSHAAAALPLLPNEASSAVSLPLQPRHHKSQPVLKQDSETRALRRTQSKQFDHPTTESEDQESWRFLDDVTEASYEDAPEHIYEERHGGAMDTEQLLKTLDKPISSDALTEQIASPDIQERKLVAEMPEQIHSPTTAGPEEYWDEVEEEELYDDQGYTTAHSYRSRGELTMGGATPLLAPKVTRDAEREILMAKRYVEANQTLEDIDDDLWDVCMVAEYGEDIFQYLRELEMQMLPDPHYMDSQMEIQWSMRSVLMDWLVQVHGRFGLLPETLFLAVNYIDRFLTWKAVSIGKLQLVGATALLVAAKYEEINCPSLDEVVYMVDHSYTMDEILKAERFMLSMLNFELGWPGPMSFLRRISKADEYDLETRTLAKYFLEVTIMDERFVASPASFLAAGAHHLSRMILKKGDWSLAHVHYSGYTWEQLKPLVGTMLECCYAPRKHHNAIFEKYSDRRYKHASDYVQAELEKGFQLPCRPSGLSQHKLFEHAGFEGQSSLRQTPNLPMPLELRA